MDGRAERAPAEALPNTVPAAAGRLRQTAERHLQEGGRRWAVGRAREASACSAAGCTGVGGARNAKGPGDDDAGAPGA